MAHSERTEAMGIYLGIGGAFALLAVVLDREEIKRNNPVAVIVGLCLFALLWPMMGFFVLCERRNR